MDKTAANSQSLSLSDVIAGTTDIYIEMYGVWANRVCRLLRSTRCPRDKFMNLGFKRNSQSDIQATNLEKWLIKLMSLYCREYRGTFLLGHRSSRDTSTQGTQSLGRGWGADTTPHKVFLSFFLEDKTSVPVVFSSCSFISRTHFETSLVMVSCYGYKI